MMSFSTPILVSVIVLIMSLFYLMIALLDAIKNGKKKRLIYLFIIIDIVFISCIIFPVNNTYHTVIT